MRQAVRELAGTFCLVILVAASARAQPAPATSWHVEFLPRFDFRLSSNALTADDPRFTWDTHWAGEFDFVDYSYGRLTFLADYQAIVGEEFRPFDPYQSNYHLEASASLRQASTEWALAFHHVSRHLGDRPMRQAVAWNTVLWRILKRIERARHRRRREGRFRTGRGESVGGLHVVGQRRRRGAPSDLAEVRRLRPRIRRDVRGR